MSSSELTVAPSIGLTIWVIYSSIALVAMILTAARGRWGFFWAGFLTAGTAWLVGSLLIAKPRSLWFGHVYGPEKRHRALTAQLKASMPRS